ncbi:hypothetical protein, partial [Rhizobium sp. Leaf453]|uniref:hypothetical protein n=1 Tax=Rhizobium sp. Leaf453 TaxID=1736380 RepID=UPI0039B7339F
DFRIRDSIHANVTLSVPAKCAHIETSVDDVAQLRRAVDVPSTETDSHLSEIRLLEGQCRWIGVLFKKLCRTLFGERLPFGLWGQENQPRMLAGIRGGRRLSRNLVIECIDFRFANTSAVYWILVPRPEGLESQ